MTLPDGDVGFLMPGPNGTMCYMRAGFLGCPPISILADKGVAPSVSWRNGVVRIEGIAADGVEEVRVTLASGEIVFLPVTGNVFLTTDTDLPQRIQWEFGSTPFELDLGKIQQAREAAKTQIAALE